MDGRQSVSSGVVMSTTARRLRDGRWSEARELTLFKSASPWITCKLCPDAVEAATRAMDCVRHTHPGILSNLNTIPKSFADPALKRRAADYRKRLVYARLPPHIRAFATRNDPKVSHI